MRQLIRMFLLLTCLTGLFYPLLITGIAQLFMKQKADGDFIWQQEKIVGAKLIAQKFEQPGYFWARPSAVDYDPLPSGGSNLGPTSATLKKLIEERRAHILKASSHQPDFIPAELLFASGSGLDPHISIPTAYFQMERVAQARQLDKEKIKNLIDNMQIKPLMGFLGHPYVNVLLLNQALDQLTEKLSVSRSHSLTRHPHFS